MKQKPSLDDLALFLAVADAGGLAGAARATGASVPTLSRRMTELERRTGQRLFQRGSHGYALTAQGRALMQEAEPLRAAALRLDRWGLAGAARPRVRITAGVWTSHYLALNIRRVWSAESEWVPEFLASNVNVDIARREADIGIRNRRPDQTWLAGRRTAFLTYAVFGTLPAPEGYVCLAEQAVPAPSDRWIRARHPDRIATTASDARLALDLALGGVGRIVLPLFIGGRVPGLTRLSEPIEEIAHEEWMVAHHDARHDPPVRKALDAVHRLLTAPDRLGG